MGKNDKKAKSFGDGIVKAFKSEKAAVKNATILEVCSAYALEKTCCT
jgi:hypothetical protein